VCARDYIGGERVPSPGTVERTVVCRWEIERRISNEHEVKVRHNRLSCEGKVLCVFRLWNELW
jgi:hypothetical protein